MALLIRILLDHQNIGAPLFCSDFKCLKEMFHLAFLGALTSFFLNSRTAMSALVQLLVEMQLISSLFTTTVSLHDSPIFKFVDILTFLLMAVIWQLTQNLCYSSSSPLSKIQIFYIHLLANFFLVENHLYLYKSQVQRHALYIKQQITLEGLQCIPLFYCD